MRRRFITADVFTDQPFGGNPVAVLPDAAGLSTDQMQRLAREFNLSETVFVLPPEQPEHDKRIRIFVPTAEVPFAGHPTIGAAIILATIGEIAIDGAETDITLKTEAGPVPVTINAIDGRPTAATLTAPKKPELRPASPQDDLAALLSLQSDQIVQAEASSCGLPFLLIEVTDRAALGRSRLDIPLHEKLLHDAWAPWPLIFTRDAADGFDIQARMYAPGAGIPEDPATGSAAAALAGWLGHHDPLQNGTLKRVIAQGIEMDRPSRLEIEVDKQNGDVTAVRVTGNAILISEGHIEVPPARG